jgi:hypothetical protein
MIWINQLRLSAPHSALFKLIVRPINSCFKSMATSNTIWCGVVYAIQGAPNRLCYDFVRPISSYLGRTKSYFHEMQAQIAQHTSSHGLSEDFCVLDSQHYSVRSVLALPMIGAPGQEVTGTLLFPWSLCCTPLSWWQCFFTWPKGNLSKQLVSHALSQSRR